MRRTATKYLSLLFLIGFIQTTINAQWSQLGTDINGEDADDRMGYSVAVSADGLTVISGARLNDGSASNAGHARVFRFDGTDWSQLGADIDGDFMDDWYGFAVSISENGETVAIGAPQNDLIGTNSGLVRVFNFDGVNWEQQGQDITGMEDGDKLGGAVSLSADGATLAVGAEESTGGAGANAGEVQVYEWTGSTWTPKGSVIEGEVGLDRAGSSVSLNSDGSIVAVGSRLNDETAPNAGHVRIFEWNGTDWIQKGTNINGESTTDESGSSVSLSADGLTVAIGAPKNDQGGNNSGQVRVYNFTAGDWMQQGLDIDGSDGDELGGSVSLSADGLKLVVGAIQGDSDNGYARVYHYDGTHWVSQGNEIVGDSQNDETGSSVAINANGSVVVVGARLDDAASAGSNTGNVRVYRFITLSSFDWVGDCIEDSVTFNYLSDSMRISNYEWDFDDGSSPVSGTDLARIKHLFSDTGYFNVKLIVTDTSNPAIMDTTIQMIRIDSCPPKIHIMNECYGDSVMFHALEDPANVSDYFWDFGDPLSSSNFASGRDVKHLYENEGTYEVTLTINFNNETTEQYRDSVRIFNIIGERTETLCLGDSIEINGVFYSTTGQYADSLTAASGCDSIVFVTLEFYSPNVVSASPSTATVCRGGTVELSASGVSNYMWSNGLGVNDTINPIVNQTRTFYVRGTDVNGCKSVDSVVVTVNDKPTVSVSSITDASCGLSTGAATISATGGTTPYFYTWFSFGSGSGSGTSLSTAPAGTHRVVVTDANFCSTTKFIAISDQDGPTVTVTKGVDANCGGADGSATSSVTGGTPPYEYLWSNQDTFPNLNNLENGSHTLTVTDDNGCVGSDEVIILSLGDNPPSISGNVTNLSNGSTVTSGIVTLFRDNVNSNISHDSIASAPIDANGNYIFNGVLPIGEYLILAIPDTLLFPTLVPSYFPSSSEPAVKWSQAGVVIAVCDSTTIANVEVLDLAPLTGTADLAGTLAVAPGKKGRQKGIGDEDGTDVRISLEGPAGIVAQTRTNQEGVYQFDNVPVADDYSIHVDIPGLGMQNTYDIDVISVGDSIINLDFLISDTSIYKDEVTSLIDYNRVLGDVKMYPNPSKDETTIEYEVVERSDVILEVYDLRGKQVYQKINLQQAPGEYRIPIAGQSTGMYIVSLKIGESLYTGRLVKMSE